MEELFGEFIMCDKKRQLTRITADLTPQAYATLNEVSTDLGTTKVGALSKGLGLIAFVLKKRKKGWTLILEKGGVRREITEF